MLNLQCGLVDTAYEGFTSDVFVRGEPAVWYIVATVTIEVRALQCHLYADFFPHD